MLKKLLSFVFAVAFALPCLADSSDVRAGTGFEIDSAPSGAVVVIDGVKRGTTPLAVQDLAPGEHFLVLSKEGYWDRKSAFVLKDGTKLVMLLELKKATGRVSILPVPVKNGNGEDRPDAQRPFRPVVYVDGQKTGPGLQELQEGVHTIRVRAFGWIDETRTVVVERGSAQKLAIEMTPAPFELGKTRTSRERFNPLNPGLLGSALISFEVSAPGYGRVTAMDIDGRQVFSAAVGPFNDWEQSVAWNGKDDAGRPLRDGEYVVRIEAEETAAGGGAVARQEGSLRLVIDASIDIRPASLLAGIGGLLFAPDARLLPAKSFQIDAGFLSGRPLGAAAYFGPPPFAFGFRASPSDGWELAAAAGVLPDASGGAAAGGSASVRKTAFGRTSSDALAGAYALRLGFIPSGAPAPFGGPSGVEAAFALEWSPFEDAPVSFVATPSLLWTGPDGLPSSLLPRAALSAGASFRAASFTAGLSARSELILDGGVRPGATLAGAEFRFFPEPSVLVFSATAGGWFDGSSAGAFGGFGFGVLY